MKERPILFSGPMVRAIIEGRKTQTRRIIKPQPLPYLNGFVAKEWSRDTKPWMPIGGIHQDKWECPYGQPGDRLWVRETWGLMCYYDPTDWMRESIVGIPESEVQERYLVEHAANWNLPSESAFWRPSIHMPRWASRITLEIVSVRAQMLQGITEEDAKAEGAEFGIYCGPDDEGPALRSVDCESDEHLASHRSGFRFLWESINGPGSWDANPFVWVIEFKEVKL